MSIIALITDFGRQDWYVASMKGVILSLDPHAVIVDITHEITLGDVRSGGFVLDQCYRDYPEGTVFVAVVDPGVGTERRNLAIKTKNHYFIGPDNGLFSFLEWNEGRKNLRIHQISSDLPGMGRKISSTFHGRDIFAPAAALLSSGSPSPFAKMGPPLDSMELLKKPEALYTPDRAEGQVVYIDHFGNAMTGLRAATIAAGAMLEIKGETIGPARRFAEVPEGALFWYENAWTNRGLGKICKLCARTFGFLSSRPSARLPEGSRWPTSAREGGSKSPSMAAARRKR